ncbi:unnamed protein product [Echinostoma caproni]|uniref:Arrestin_C domain-containing protein n=1 Tax=Echinostoma caproni TaxID=27848 RepID=A0A183AWW7_9TREM|nr:unnamed protein product [Echinostoma caproni]
MDGDLKHEDTNLASSSITPPHSAPRVPVGILVQYKVKVRLILGFSISDVCLELPFILTHPNPEEHKLDDREPDTEEVFSLSMPREPQQAVKALPVSTAPVCAPPPAPPIQSQRPLAVNNISPNSRPRSSSPINRLHDQPSGLHLIPVNGNLTNGDHRRTQGSESIVPSQVHPIMHRHTSSAVSAPPRANTIPGIGFVDPTDQFVFGPSNHDQLDQGNVIATNNTAVQNDNNSSNHSARHPSQRNPRTLGMPQTHRNSTLFSSVGHAVTLPLCATQSPIFCDGGGGGDTDGNVRNCLTGHKKMSLLEFIFGPSSLRFF